MVYWYQKDREKGDPKLNSPEALNSKERDTTGDADGKGSQDRQKWAAKTRQTDQRQQEPGTMTSRGRKSRGSTQADGRARQDRREIGPA